MTDEPYYDVQRWRDPDQAYHSRTYILSEAIIERLGELRKEHACGVSELVNFLLTDSLRRLDSGALDLPLRCCDWNRIVFEPYRKE